MIPSKTEKAEIALQTRDLSLSTVQRHILIVCNGERSVQDIADLIGPQVHSLVNDLFARGFVRNKRALAPSENSATLAAASTRAAAPPVPAKRRSLVMARMYLFDLMERVLGQQGDVVRQHLRGADTPERIGEAMCACIELLVELAEPGITMRAAAQVADMLPDEHQQWATRVRAVADSLRHVA
ncbi:MAG: hypothetical protein KGL42_15985 [Betaproteobacteria bacterium]|nr:hypothetical protein [Betaproteobacteria bacterium]